MKIPKDFKPIIFTEISYIYKNLYCLYHQSSQCSISSHFVFYVFCVGLYVPLKNFSLLWSRHHYMYRWRASKFDLCSTLTATEQWGFFSLSHLLESVYNGHLRALVILTPVADHLAVELSLPVLTTYNSGGWDSNTQPSTCKSNTLTNCATAAVNHFIHWLKFICHVVVCVTIGFYYPWLAVRGD